jgi:hypothetical protein
VDVDRSVRASLPSASPPARRCRTTTGSNALAKRPLSGMRSPWRTSRNAIRIFGSCSLDRGLRDIGLPGGVYEEGRAKGTRAAARRQGVPVPRLDR